MQSTLDWKVDTTGSAPLHGRRRVRFQHLQEMLPRLPHRLERDGWWLTDESGAAERFFEHFSMSSRQGQL